MSDYNQRIYRQSAEETAVENAEITRSVLGGERGPRFVRVVFNAGIGLFANGQAGTIQEGVKLATDSILSGRALEKLEAVIAFSEKIGQKELAKMTILDKILQEKQLEVEALLAGEKVAVKSGKTRPSLFQRLYNAEKLQVIAEMKRASPSKGLIAEGADPVKQARIYSECRCRVYFSVNGCAFFQRFI